ncbi:MAG: hypothetical protein ACHQX1_03185, partial [Candidatus Micrarchaeales archaeon]
MDEEEIVYIVFTSVIPILVIANLSAFGGGIYTYIVVIMCALLLGFILIMNFADYLLFPLITGMLGITFQPYKDYKITKSQEAVIKNVNGLYYATGYLTANLFSFVFKAEREEEGQDIKQVQAVDIWEKVVMSIPFSFKFHVISTGRDIQVVRDELEGKRSYQEFQMSKAISSNTSNEVIIGDIQRKINVIQTQIDRISQGEKPIASLMYFETTAVGVSEKAALDTLSAQLKQLQIAASSLDVQLLRIVGRELYILFTYSFSLPT